MKAFFQSTQHIFEKRERSGTGSGSAPLTNGFGTRRPKKMRILRIQIRFWIRILTLHCWPFDKSLIGNFCGSGSGQVRIILPDPNPDWNRHSGHANPDPADPLDCYQVQANEKADTGKLSFFQKI